MGLRHFHSVIMAAENTWYHPSFCYVTQHMWRFWPLIFQLPPSYLYLHFLPSLSACSGLSVPFHTLSLSWEKELSCGQILHLGINCKKSWNYARQSPKVDLNTAGRAEMLSWLTEKPVNYFNNRLIVPVITVSSFSNVRFCCFSHLYQCIEYLLDCWTVTLACG